MNPASPPRSRAADDPPGPTVALGERFRALHTHMRTIAGSASLSAMLPTIARSAAELVGAAGTAIALLDGELAIEQTVQYGMAGVLDLDLTGVRSLDRLEDELTARGIFFTQAEIRVGGDLHGVLFVCEPHRGEFTDDDIEVLIACAVSFGSAIERALLSHRARSSVQWLQASGEIARAMLADADIDALTEIVARAVDAADADYGHLVIPTTDGRLRVLAAHGNGIEDYLGATYDAEMSDLARAVVNGKTLRGGTVADYLTSGWVNTHGFGPFVLAPLLDALGTRGSVLLVRYADRTPFAQSDLTQFATYTAQVALAMQFADARTDAERLQRVEARANASRELSDIVMQRLFAVGIGLDMLSVHLAHTPHSDKLERHITDLDATIEEIRSRVFVDEDAFPDVDVRFPRLLLPADTAVDPAPVLRGPARRGRRRSDWQDGTGTQR